MMSCNLLSTEQYKTLRYNILLNVEEGGDAKLSTYADSEGIPTIGIGFNLQDEDALNAILVEFGFVFNANQNEQEIISSDKDIDYREEIIEIVSALYNNNDPYQMGKNRVREQ